MQKKKEYDWPIESQPNHWLKVVEAKKNFSTKVPSFSSLSLSVKLIIASAIFFSLLNREEEEVKVFFVALSLSSPPSLSLSLFFLSSPIKRCKIYRRNQYYSSKQQSATRTTTTTTTTKTTTKTRPTTARAKQILFPFICNAQTYPRACTRTYRTHNRMRRFSSRS